MAPLPLIEVVWTFVARPGVGATVVDQLRLGAGSRPTVMLVKPLRVNLSEGVQGDPMAGST